VAGTLAALDLVHVYNSQVACSAECRKIGNDGKCTARRHETGVVAGGLSRFTALVRPPTVADDPSVCYGHHVCLIEPVLAAEFREIDDRRRGRSARVDKAIVAFDIVALADAVLMCPSLVRLEFAHAFCEPMHGREVQTVLTAKFVEIDY
jgi:hypothetical protein